MRGFRYNGYFGSRLDLCLLGLSRRAHLLALDWYESRLQGFSWRGLAYRVGRACFGDNRVDTSQPAGIDLHVRITMPDTGEVIVSKIGKDKSLQHQLDELLALNELCETNQWEMEAWR